MDGVTPNIVLINCDDLGYGDLGCYGSTRNASPRIDRLATEGRRFTSFYMASPVCSPSRGALLTGCYPPRFGFGSFEGLPVLFPGQAVGLPPHEVSIARVLSSAGYATEMIGKWHCGDQDEFLPVNHGFDHWFGLPYSNDMGRQSSTHPALPDMPPLPLVDGKAGGPTSVVERQPDQTTLTARYVEAAVSFMRTNATHPFFLYLAHMYVHLPLYVEDRYQPSPQMYLDLNANGQRDTGEPGVKNTPMTLEMTERMVFRTSTDVDPLRISTTSVSGAPTGALRPMAVPATASLATFSCTTSRNGTCANSGLPAGTFRVTTDFNPDDLGLRTMEDPDGDGDLIADTWPIPEDDGMRPLVFGFAGLGTLTGQVWVDNDASETFTDGDEALVDVPMIVWWAGIDLTINTDDDVAIQIGTDDSGSYLLQNVPAGDYAVEIDSLFRRFPIPAAITLALARQGTAHIDIWFRPGSDLEPPDEDPELPVVGTGTTRALPWALLWTATGLMLIGLSRRRRLRHA